VVKQKYIIIIKKILGAISLSVFATVVLAVAIYYLPYIPATKKTMASSTDNLSGWAWFSTIGWVSFNNTNLNSAIPYGENIDMAIGDFNDGSYAWSSNVGWIDFNPAGPFPDISTNDDYNYPVELDLDSGELRGWARIICMSGDGGWIRFHPDDDDLLKDDWGVELETGANRCTADGKIRIKGYGWSDDFGWIKFNGTTQDGNEYGVYLDATPGILSNISASPSISSPCSAVSVSWAYNGSNATGFEVRRKTAASNWTSVCNVGANVFGCVDSGLSPGAEYFYQARSLGECNNSDWTSSVKTTTSSVCAFLAGPNGDIIHVKGQCPNSTIVSWSAPNAAPTASIIYSVSRKETKDEDGNVVAGAPWVASSNGTCSANPVPPSCTDTIAGASGGKRTYIYKVKAKDTNTGDYVEAESEEIIPCPPAPSWIEK